MSWGIGFGERRGDDAVKRPRFLPTETPKRKRFRPVLAGCGVLVFALVCLWARCAKADMIEINFSGTMVDWQGISVYNALLSPACLQTPTPFEITVLIPEDCQDTDPSTTRGLYNNGVSLTFAFGPFSETHEGQVEIWSNHGTLWGVFIRNKSACSAYGVYRPANTGIYAFYTSVDSAVAPALIPTDALEHVFAIAENPMVFESGKHAYHNGTKGYPPVTIHAEADNDLSDLSAELVE